MQTLILDVETTFQIDKRGNYDPSPFNPSNYLVSIGFKFLGEEPKYLFFRHNDLTDIDVAANREEVQEALDRADLMVCHNAKFDLMWLLECGFVYDKPVYDTMVAEYVYLRTRKVSLKLVDVAARRGCQSVKRTDLTDEYLKKGIGFEAMPVEIVTEYGIADVETTGELYVIQQGLLDEPRNAGLRPTIEMSNEFLLALMEAERNGIAVDTEALDAVEKEFRAEKAEIEERLGKIVSHVMGDRPINLASDEHLSMVVYSRKVRDKKLWADTFNLGSELRGQTRKPKRRNKMSRKDFQREVQRQTTVVYRQRAEHCTNCSGTGKVRKTKKDGTPYAKETKCPTCFGEGYVYHDLPEVAGLGISPRDFNDTAAHGFRTNKDTLARLARAATKNVQSIFLNGAVRLNALESYLSTVVEGIRRGTRPNTGLLHTRLNQTVTATGRLSSADP